MSPSSSRSEAQSAFPCPKCEKVYTRRSHLTRHEATHSGQKASRCPFCGCSFVKSEVARRHAKTCPRRGDSDLPPGAKRGRKAQACDRCAKNKASCDKNKPCARCRAHNVACSYRRVEDDNESMQMRFLLKFTDASHEHPAPTLFDDVMDEPTAVHVSADPTQSLFPIDDDSFFSWSLSDLLLDRVPEPPWDITDEQNHMPGLLPSNVAEVSALDVRVEEILNALSSTHERMLICRPEEAAEFDLGLARSVFTPENLVEFCSIYFSRCHPQAPIVHRPSFAPETAPTPVLLGIFASASVFSAPQDHAISTRRFLSTIEEYIFSFSPFQQRYAHNQSFTDLEVMQAAWIIIALQGSMNNNQTSQRVRVERLPRLIYTIRTLGWTGIRHGGEGLNWQLWIENEIRIRLATYMFWGDSHNSMFFNCPPQMVVSEMTADLPSSDDIFEAETVSDFEKMVLGQRSSPPPLSQLIPMLLHGPIPDTLPHRLSVHNLFVAICSLESPLFSARTGGFGKEALGAIYRATERWEGLWNTVTQNMSLETQKRYQIGVMKHAAEVCWLIRTVIQVVESGDRSCSYMQNIATDSPKDLHDFIRKYKDMYSCGISGAPAV